MEWQVLALLQQVDQVVVAQDQQAAELKMVRLVTLLQHLRHKETMAEMVLEMVVILVAQAAEERMQ